MTNKEVILVGLVMRCVRQVPAPIISNRQRCHINKIDLTLCSSAVSVDSKPCRLPVSVAAAQRHVLALDHLQEHR